MKKDVVIFFPNHHLAYSPTTINLYRSLEDKFNVKIIAPYPSAFNNKELTGFNVEYFKDPTPSLRMKAQGLLLLIVKNIFHLLAIGKIVYTYPIIKALLKYDYLFKEAAKKHKDDIIVAVDITFLKIATLYFKKVNFVSLELTDEFIPLLNTIPQKAIQSVVIQTGDRYRYLFGNRKLNVFYIQNSVFYDSGKMLSPKKANTLIFSGTASRFFGINYFLDFLTAYSDRFTAVIKGNISKDIDEELQTKYKLLIENGKLVPDSSYIETEQLSNYVSAFEIGFCFYDIEAIKENRFNYLTAPSGKMFTYFASGVPIVATNIPGLKIIEDFGAGVLIDDYSPENILDAVNTIKADYYRYSANCLRAAEHFSFNKQAEPFVEFLSSYK